LQSLFPELTNHAVHESAHPSCKVAAIGIMDGLKSNFFPYDLQTKQQKVTPTKIKNKSLITL
jgi:hypothetical protein